MSYSVLKGLFATGTMDGVNDAVTLSASKDTPSYVIAVTSATGLSGLTIVVEVQLYEGSPWYTKSFYLSNETGAGNTHLNVTAALAAVPAYFMCAHTGAVHAIRARCSAITGGSAEVRVMPQTQHSY